MILSQKMFAINLLATIVESLCYIKNAFQEAKIMKEGGLKNLDGYIELDETTTFVYICLQLLMKL